MAENILSTRAVYNESEFLAGSGACGPTALAGADRWYHSIPTPTAVQTKTLMQQAGLCTSTGVTTLPKMAQFAKSRGMPVQLRPAGMGVLDYAARSFLSQSNLKPGFVILEVTNGQAIRDYLTGAGEDAIGLQNHIFGLFGYNSGGWCAFLGFTVPAVFLAIDGDSNLVNNVVNGVRVHRAINQTYCYYTTAVLSAARPYDAFSIVRL